jgi:16S rRNA (uracil1498-N3)-methyltransferase
MPRFFLDPATWGDEASLIGDEAKHCSRVLRSRVGDQIVVFDGRGREAQAEILTLGRDCVAIRLGQVKAEPPPEVEIVLAQAVLKGKAMDWLLQKSVELGVSQIQPLSTRHAVVQPGDGKEEKWQRVVLEACKQCGRSRIPEVMPTVGVGEFLKKTSAEPRVIASLQSGAQPLRETLENLKNFKRVTLIVGPEGDFSSDEYQQFKDAGCIPVNLGPAVLRSETAAIYVLAASTYAFS